jgi:hypothetical protein
MRKILRFQENGRVKHAPPPQVACPVDPSGPPEAPQAQEVQRLHLPQQLEAEHRLPELRAERPLAAALDAVAPAADVADLVEAPGAALLNRKFLSTSSSPKITSSRATSPSEKPSRLT